MRRFSIIIFPVFLLFFILPAYALSQSGTVHELTDIVLNNDVSKGSVSFEFADENGSPDVQKIEQHFPDRIMIVLKDTQLGGDLRQGLFYETLFSTIENGINRIYVNEHRDPSTVVITLYHANNIYSKLDNMNNKVAVLQFSDEKFPEGYGGRLIASQDGLKSPADQLDEIISKKVNEKMSVAADDIDKQIELLEETIRDLKQLDYEKPQVQKQGDRYRIQTGDKLEIAIVGEPDFQKNVVVRPDGYISYPLLGDVVAEDLAPEELAMILKSRLMKGYFNYDISLSVTVMEYMPSKVYLLGNFSQAGPVDYRKGMTLLDILGRFEQNEVDLDTVSVIRKGEGKFDVNLKEVLMGDIEQNIVLQPNDYILLTSNEQIRVMIFGKVRLPGLYKVRSDSRIYDAIGVAGGVADRCDIRHVLLLRERDGVPEKIEVNLRKFAEELDISQNLALADRDIIFVPETDRFDWEKMLTVLQRAGQVFYDIHLVTR